MSEQAPAGWYPDGSGDERYWDGAAWTAHVRTPQPAPPAPPTDESANVFSKLGTAVKKAASDKKASKDEALRLHEERALAAGRLVTSGIFGTSTIEIYEHGFVRVAPGGERYAEAEKITKKTPYERLRSITFGVPEAERAHDTEGPGSPIEGAVMQAMSGIVRGGKLLTKGTAVGIAATGVAHLASNSARKSNLVIATDKTIHTLTNQKHNGFIQVSQKEHNAVAVALVEAGNAVLGIEPVTVAQPSISATPDAAPPAQISVAAVAVTPSLSDRIRELSELHREGILSDDEFSAAKGKLLAGL
ncbi:DUF2510 domain-containing protein [Microbacterium sp. 22215]|uniref:DUF2510 domain-containing protein n=1 Tax=Microbacterium sp. 22215 TaxID=3453893 RepID=UPI003F825853